MVGGGLKAYCISLLPAGSPAGGSSAMPSVRPLWKVRTTEDDGVLTGGVAGSDGTINIVHYSTFPNAHPDPPQRRKCHPQQSDAVRA